MAPVSPPPAGAWLIFQPIDPALAVTQLAKLRRQLPLLYALLVINLSAVAYTHYGTAPWYLTILFPMVLCGTCCVRGIAWAIPSRRVPSTAKAVGQLRGIAVLAGILSAAFVTWALVLNRYGDAAQQGHIAFFIAITVIGCIFCLMHLPQAALLVTGVVLAPYLAFYVSVGSSVSIAIAVNLSLVAMVMIQVLANNFRAFVDLEQSKIALAAEQAQSRSLSAENALLANTDSLTGLPNRRWFFNQFDDLVAAAGDTPDSFSLCLVDLDGFKPINDSFGHAMGDRVLIETGRRLRTLAGPLVHVARLGGDEFGVLVVGPADVATTLAFGRTVSDRLGESMAFEGLQLACRASCGMARHTRLATSSAALYDQADYALYDAKAHARGGAVLFSREHDDRLKNERAIEAALLAADLDAEMDVHFQPIVDLTRGCDVGAEALARWTSPVLGQVRPDQFIDVAEQAGLMRNLTPVLLDKALAHVRRWPETLGLSFNLSAHDIVSPETICHVIASVRRSGVDPGRITLELTETAVTRDFELAGKHIAALRAIGIRIALDDFGVGYSSLSCVRRLPLDKIKIDRSFVQNISHEPECRQIVKAILDLCTTLGLDCIVEGVEDLSQCAVVSQLGGRHVQGYHFGKPMPGRAFLDRVTAGQPLVAAA